MFLADPVGERWYDHDWDDEIVEFTFLTDYRLKPGARVFNLGAHQGIVAMILARLVGPEGAVLAVEANPHNAKVAETNRSLNELSQMKVVHAAVGETAGSVTFNELLNGKVDDSRSHGAIRVRSVTLDDLAAEYGTPQVVLLDVEGFECHALRGAKKLLSAPADWCIEVHAGAGLEDYGSSVDQVISHFPTSDFELFMAPASDPTKSYPFVPFDPKSPALSQRFYLIASKKS